MHHHHAHAFLQPRTAHDAADAPEFAERLVPREPVPARVLVEDGGSPVLLARQSTSSCGPDDNDGRCQKPVSSNATVIAVATVRYKRRLAQEDLNDKHKSLDFGLGDDSGKANANGKKNGRKGKKGAEMSMADPNAPSRRDRGLSMDMDMGSPYLLPAGLHQSRESFHSLSRSMKDQHDPYRSVVSFSPRSDDPYSPVRREDSSIYTASTHSSDRMNGHLLRNASKMSQSRPPVGSPLSANAPPIPEIRVPEAAKKPLPMPTVSRKPVDAPAPYGHHDNNADPSHGNNDYLGNFIHSREPSPVSDKPSLPTPPKPPTNRLPSPPVPPGAPAANRPQVPDHGFDFDVRRNSPPDVAGIPGIVEPVQGHNGPPQRSNPIISVASSGVDYDNAFRVTPPSPPRQPSPDPAQPRRYSMEAPPRGDSKPQGLGVQAVDYDNHRLSMSVRPLPIEDPTDNPEQRANRIRSFYKEYFDDSKPAPQGRPAYEEYHYDGHGGEYLDGAVYDPETGNFIFAQAPYAQPITRRAMTPPPRAPPRFRAPSGSTVRSAGSGGLYPPRGFSAMSARSAPARKPMAPPKSLMNLPTPHLLKDDSAIFNAGDFAPPTSFRERQNGRRPDSPLAMQRPFSPSVSPHIPLASSYNELSPVPSPHHLRKSGTFTALDFAPPPRFRNADGGSDTASLRSNKSGISAVALHSVRAGAYRVSRIPKEMVSTRDDMINSLRPKMDLVNPA